MKKYLAVGTLPDNTAVFMLFSADDMEHAEEQLRDAEPDAINVYILPFCASCSHDWSA